jgi:hypothetical protein
LLQHGQTYLLDEVLNDDQRRRVVVKLFALIRADVDAQSAAVLADPLGLGQLVMPRIAGQVLRQAPAAVRPATSLRLGRRWRFDRHCCGRVLARGHLGEQQHLVGIEPFIARSVQPAQQ